MKTTVWKTTRFELDFGVNPGYFHNNWLTSEQIACEAFQIITEHVYKKTGVAISGVITPTATIYREAWGCPKSGEKTVKITGLRNPEFMADDPLWRETVREVCTMIRKHFQQTTAYLSFSEVDFEYLKNDP